MKIQRVVGAAAGVLAIVSLLSLVGYFMALHDIARDYASPMLLRAQGLPGWEALPEWTTCSLEWRILAVGFLPMVLFHVFFLGCYALGWRLRREHPTGSARPVD